MMKRGFTLIEMLLYIAIVAGMATASVLFVTNITSGRIKATVEENVTYTGRYVVERIGREIRGASGVSSLASTDLCLTMVEPTRNPTRIYLENGGVKIGWGGSCATLNETYTLTGPDITVTDLSFADLSSGGSQNINYVLTLQGKVSSVRQEWQFGTTLEGADEIRTN